MLFILIRNNWNIEWIKIYGEDFKIQQSADDASLISDGSASSFDGILQTLHYIAEISGLEINFGKTKNIWTGSKKNLQKCLPTQKM